jgi:hypothetical protein
MKFNALAVLSFLICFLIAVPPIVSAYDNTEVYVVALDSGGYSNYMESIGEGQFAPQEFIDRVSGYSYGNGIGDFDNDGDLDYIMGSGFNSGSIYLYEKLGPGNQFDSPLAVGVWGEGNIPVDIAIADFNEDGKLDFILVQYNSINCEMYTGDGQLGFTSSVIVDAAPEFSVGADAADFNDDGHADFVVAPYMSHEDIKYFYVNLGHGDGTFTTIEVETYDYSTYWGVAAGDFDGDGIADLVATNFGFIDVYLGVGDGTFDWGERIPDPGVHYYAPVDNYDFNGDQIQDIVIGRYGSRSGVGVFLGDGEGGFSHSNTYFGGSGGERFAVSAPPYVQNKNKGPVAVVDPAYQEITAGETVFFDAQGSYDEDGKIVSYAWNFEDDGFLEAKSLGAGPTAEYVFYQAGLYTITLTVTDDKGATNSVQAQVQVDNVSANITFRPKTLNLRSKGKWVSATIKLPAKYDASQIYLGSACIGENETHLVYAHSDPTKKKARKHHKKKKTHKLKVKFDRQALVAAINGPSDKTELHIQGQLLHNGGLIPFKGSVTIRTIDPGKKDKADKKHKRHKKNKKSKKKR